MGINNGGEVTASLVRFFVRAMARVIIARRTSIPCAGRALRPTGLILPRSIPVHPISRELFAGAQGLSARANLSSRSKGLSGGANHNI